MCYFPTTGKLIGAGCAARIDFAWEERAANHDPIHFVKGHMPKFIVTNIIWLFANLCPNLVFKGPSSTDAHTSGAI